MKKWIQLVKCLVLVVIGQQNCNAQTRDIVGPVGSEAFGGVVFALSNGNYVVADRLYDAGSIEDAGAVYLFDGETHTQISKLVGSANGRLFGAQIYELPSGDFVIQSSAAVTWASGTTGVNGVVDASNSLLNIQLKSLHILSNGNYVLRGDNSATWVAKNGIGPRGPVSNSNSLIGPLGLSVTPLSNGNYVIGNPDFLNASNERCGAVTWANGAVGITGTMSASNSIIGVGNSRIGSRGIVPLTNGHYVIASSEWNGGVTALMGAVTWMDGTTPATGTVNASNSLIGSSVGDEVGEYVHALTNGNYVVSSRFWDNGSISNAGAATWGNGATGTVGVVSASNSLVGTSVDDQVGRATILTNGNYLVNAPTWDNAGVANVGAVVWCNGSVVTAGAVNASNSLVGVSSGDLVGYFVKPLTNGNYLVQSPYWKNVATPSLGGAVTWGNGSAGITGSVSVSNSLVGANFDDERGAIALTNGNYVVCSPFWNNNLGAATWGNGTAGTVGAVTATNSLTGVTPDRHMLGPDVYALPNGNYVVTSYPVINGNRREAATWGNGSSGTTGLVTPANSLIGSANDEMAFFSMTVNALENSDYIVQSTEWREPGDPGRRGAIAYGSGLYGVTGEMTACNGVAQTNFFFNGSIVTSYNYANKYAVVGRPEDNIVSIFSPSGKALASSLDNGSLDLKGSESQPILAEEACRIIAALEPSGANPVSGPVSAKAWVEGSVPTFGGDPFVARHYEITPAQNAATATGKLTLYFSQEEFNAFNAAPGSTLDLPANANDASGKANLRIGKYAGTSSNGSGLPDSYASIISAIIDPVDDDIIWNETFQRWEVTFDTEGFSGFVVQTSTVPLPVRLVSFTGKVAENAVKLSWQIADAVNFNHFEVERSTDAKRFEYLGKVNFEEGKENYALTDLQPESGSDGQAHYRLKMVDLDGSYAFSKITSVRLDGSGAAYVYPNPVAGHFKISLPGYEGKTGRMRLINASGKVLYDDTFTVKNGELSRDLKKSRYEEGAYVIQLDFGDERRQFKITLVH